MSRTLCLIAAAILVTSSLGIVGCQTSTGTASGPAMSGFAGGDGAFGESPLAPGYYPSDKATPGTNSLASR